MTQTKQPPANPARFTFTGILWADDNQIVDPQITKAYDQERPRVEMAVKILTDASSSS